MNSNIIKQLEKLVAMIIQETNFFIKEKNKKAITRNKFRLRYTKNLIYVIENLDYQITIDNYKQLKEFDGVGKGSIDRIKEIITTGFLKEVKGFKEDSNNKKKSLKELEQIIGVGKSNAIELYNQGATSISKLKKLIKSNKIQVNDKIILGLKYHGICKTNIPRKEIDKVYKMLTKIFNKVNKKFTDKNKYCFEICGSYRRQKLLSNDIDLLITKFDNNDEINHLEFFVDLLKSNLKFNNNKPFLIDDMTDKNIETKYMGFSKYKNKPIRRIDIRFIAYSSYHSALLYFTGSYELNKKMRNIAKSKGFKLSEYGLFKNNKKIKIKSEKDIFKKLGMDYIEPKFR